MALKQKESSTLSDLPGRVESKRAGGPSPFLQTIGKVYVPSEQKDFKSSALHSVKRLQREICDAAGRETLVQSLSRNSRGQKIRIRLINHCEGNADIRETLVKARDTPR